MQKLNSGVLHGDIRTVSHKKCTEVPIFAGDILNAYYVVDAKLRASNVVRDKGFAELEVEVKKQ